MGGEAGKCGAVPASSRHQSIPPSTGVMASLLVFLRNSSLTPPPPPVQKVLRPTQFFCITPFLKCPTQLICISHIYLLSTDKYKRHIRGICYPWTNLSNCMWSHELFFMMIFFGSLYCLIRKRVILLCTVVIQLSVAFKWMREKMIWYYLDVYKSPFKVLLIFVENLWRNNLSNLNTSNPVFTTNP